MIGQTMNFEKYRSSLQTTQGPYPVSAIPQIEIDYKGLIEYAHSKGKSVKELTDEEKNLFICNSDMEEVRQRALTI